MSFRHEGEGNDWRFWIAFYVAVLVSVSFERSTVADSPTYPNGTAVRPESNSHPTSIPWESIQIAAHRGGYQNDKADDAPENSVANIQVCHRKGYQIYETDIQRTRDGHFVIMHDVTIDRETNGSGEASEMTLAELKRLYKKFRDGSLSNHRVATLDEFLSEGKKRVLFKADLKPGVSQYFGEIMQVVSDHGAIDDIIFRVPYRDADQFEKFKASGVAMNRNSLMFMVSNKKQVDDIKRRFDPANIQVNIRKDAPCDPRTIGLIRYAADQGMIVETHAEGTNKDWLELTRAGVRMFHTTKPEKIKTFLRESANKAAKDR